MYVVCSWYICECVCGTECVWYVTSMWYMCNMLVCGMCCGMGCMYMRGSMCAVECRGVHVVCFTCVVLCVLYGLCTTVCDMGCVCVGGWVLGTL